MDTSDEEIVEGGLDRDYVALTGGDSATEIVPEGGANDDVGEQGAEASQCLDEEYGLMLESLGVADEDMLDGKTQVYEWPGNALKHRYVFPPYSPSFISFIFIIL